MGRATRPILSLTLGVLCEKMRHTITTLMIMACAGCATAETNAPIVMKGIYSANRPRGSHAKRERTTHNVTTDALRRFVLIQNPDGSWGADGTQQLSTAFCLISFLRHGESRHSETFGKSIANAHAWLMASQPKRDPERVATAIALSDYITLHHRWHYHPGGKKKSTVPAEQIQKIRNCINGISPQCGEMWRDLLSLSRLPEEIGRRQDGDTIRATLNKYLDREPDGSPSKLDDYLLLHLTSSARFHRGGKEWSEWNRQFAPMMIRTQKADGLFPCVSEGDRIPATGFSVMSLTVYYIWSHRFTARAWPKQEEAEDQEIEINL